MFGFLKRTAAPKPPQLATRRFDGASGRRFAGTPSFGPIGPETMAAGPMLRSRARAAYANNHHARAGADAWVAALIGAGIKGVSRHPDETGRSAIQAALADWSDLADADGRTDAYGLQAEIARGLVIDGEAVVILNDTPDGLRLRLIPAEFLDESRTTELGGGAHIVSGVEFDAAGNRVAYWIRRSRPTDLFATSHEAVRVPAADVLHIFKPIGAGQVRGVSWFAPILLKLNEIDQLEDALLVGVKVAAMHAGFLVDINGTGVGTVPYDGTQAGDIMTSGLEPGTLKVLPAGTDIKFSTPQQAQQTIEFMSAEIRAVSVGLGVPAHLVSGDLSKANYSSLRADLISWRSRVEQVQYGTLVPQLCRPVHRRALTLEVLAGRLDAPDFESNPAAWLGADFIVPAVPEVDPSKAADATATMLAQGLTSRRKAVAEQGWDVDALDAEIAADNARAKALGLTFGAPPPMASAAPGDPSNPAKEPAANADA